MNTFSNLADFNNALSNARAGETYELRPGSYEGEISVDRKGDFHVILDRVTFRGNGLYGIDLKGEGFTVSINESLILGGNAAGITQRGDNIKLLGTDTVITENNYGLDILGTGHLLAGFEFRDQVVGGISGNNLKLDPIKRTHGQGFYYGPSNNWRISKCSFYDIAPYDPGNAGGGIRLIPHVKDIIVDNCYFENIDGNALWTDHSQGGIQFLYNRFHKVTGKCIFFEIADDNPNNRSDFTGIFAGNMSRDCDRHGIAIMASGAHKPRGIQIFGNDMEGWPIVLAGMPRDFYRRFDPQNPAGWERVDAELKNIHVHHNVLKVTTGRNHLMAYDGPLSDNIEIESNYYVTGYESDFKGRPVLIDNAYFSFDDGKFLHGRDEAGLQYDPTGKIGPRLNQFPYSDSESGLDQLPVLRLWDYDSPDMGGGDPIIIPDPDPDPNPNPTPNPANDLPNIWVFSDFSNMAKDGSADADKDDYACMGPLFLCQFGRYNIAGITVGAYPTPPRAVDYEYVDPLAAFDKIVRVAVESEIGPIDCPVVLADSHRLKFDKSIPTKSILPVISALKNNDRLLLANWGPLTEIAHLLEHLSAVEPELLSKVEILSHFTLNETDNNHRKDKLAYQYISDLNAQGKIKFIECDRAGADLIDDKKPPMLDGSVLASAIGSLLHYKWQEPTKAEGKPDFSDFITIIVAAFAELGFGINGEAYKNLKTDGSSNLALIKSTFGDQKKALYDIIEDAASKAVAGELGSETTNPDPDPNPNPDTGSGGDESKVAKIIAETIDEIAALLSDLSDQLNSL